MALLPNFRHNFPIITLSMFPLDKSLLYNVTLYPSSRQKKKKRKRSAVNESPEKKGTQSAQKFKESATSSMFIVMLIT